MAAVKYDLGAGGGGSRLVLAAGDDMGRAVDGAVLAKQVHISIANQSRERKSAQLPSNRCEM